MDSDYEDLERKRIARLLGYWRSDGDEAKTIRELCAKAGVDGLSTLVISLQADMEGVRQANDQLHYKLKQRKRKIARLEAEVAEVRAWLVRLYNDDSTQFEIDTGHELRGWLHERGLLEE